MAKPVEVDAACTESWKELTDAKTETNWVLWGFEGNVLKPVGSGTGGLAEIVTKFEDTQVLFGGLKVVGVDQRENVVSRRPKFIAITWKGPNVPVLKRAAVSIQREQVQKHMQGIAAALDIGAPEELNQKELAKKLLGAGGAHKPTHYEFGPDQLVPIDQLV